MKSSEIREELERGQLFDGAIVRHGFTPYLRDYDIVAYFAKGPEYLYRFSHCPIAEVTTAVPDDVWQRSWGDDFIDYSEWLKSGEPAGYVWGVCESTVYPGAKYIADSRLAQEWTSRLGKQMHEVLIITNGHNLHLVFHDLSVKKLKETDPEWVNVQKTW
ncbi:MAG TPA: hypothetical protein VKP61_04815 [Candidatus Acidoferrum sp.]|nr:hypothetical protein [Candidatus Acidoferrum sp.]